MEQSSSSFLKDTTPHCPLLHQLDDVLLYEILEYLNAKEICVVEMAGSKRLRQTTREHWNYRDQNTTIGKSIAWTNKERVCKYEACKSRAAQWFLQQQLQQQEQIHNQQYRCPGCCESLDYDPNTIFGMEFFVWIAVTRPQQQQSLSHDVIWQGFVPNTFNSLLVGHDTTFQKSTQTKWNAFRSFCSFLEQHSQRKKVVDRSVLDDNHNYWRQAMSGNLYILVLAVSYNSCVPCQIMEVTPHNNHVQIHWDDCSYNHHHQNEILDTSAISSNHNSRIFTNGEACFHIWLELSPSKPPIWKEIRMDKCASSSSIK